MSDFAAARERDRLAVEAFRSRYNAQRVYCPSCRSSNWAATWNAFPVTVRDGVVDESFVDRNRVTCLCGWSGIFHSLKGDEE